MVGEGSVHSIAIIGLPVGPRGINYACMSVFWHNCSCCKNKQQTTIGRACWKWFNMPCWSPLWINDNWHWCNPILWLISVWWLVSAINLLMCIVKNCLSLCCLSVCFYFASERLQRRWFPPGKTTNGGKSCTGPPNWRKPSIRCCRPLHLLLLAVSFWMMHTGRRENGSGGADGITENRQIETRNRYLRPFPAREK